MKKLISPGISDFKTLIDENYYYVDKTLLIDDIMHNGQIILMTRPRRFGKTLNLSMLKYFFEKSDTPHEYLFVDKNIWQHADHKKIHSTFPVIFLTFKNINELTWEAAFIKFTLIISQEYARHSFLLQSDTIQAHEKDIFNQILNRTAPQADVENSLQFLAALLYRHYNRRVIVLIDEYDTLAQAGHLNRYYQTSINFLRGLLVAVLKDSTILEKGILTGVATLAKAGIFTGLNNLNVFNLTDLGMADKFGFTKQETEALLSKYALLEHSAAVQKWYDGYTFGMTTGIFNPWSVMKCTEKQGSLENYWANTSENILVRNLIARAPISLKKELERLLNDEIVYKTIDDSLTFPDIEKQADSIWTLLLCTGYVTYESYELKKGKKICALKIPNKEVKYLFEDLLKKIVKSGVQGEKVDELIQSLFAGDTDYFAELFQSFVLNTMSAFDLPQAEPEKSYHLFVLGLLATLSDEYVVKSNRESGLGRYDVMIIPKDIQKTAVIMEFKVARKLEKLEPVAQKALDQIIEKKYAQELKAHGINSFIAYGIAFAGKNILVKKLE